MANDFYQATGNPGTRSQGQSSVVRAEFADIEDAFDKMPTLTGNAGKAVVINGGATGLGVTAGTLALAGNFATVGAFALALSLNGATNLTLPVTGTLATLAGTETLTNKTLTAPTLTAPVLGTPASGNLANCTGLPSGSIVGQLPAGNFPALTGDVTTSGGSLGTTLATVNPNVGTFGNGSSVGTFTVDGKGRITAAANVTIAAPAGTLTGNTLAATVTASSLTSVGTITSGTWQGTPIGPAYGGTGSSSIAPAGSVIFAAASGVYGYDNGNLHWNNTDKTLGIGSGAPSGASWRTLIRSFGFGTYPLVMTANVSGATIFYVGENGGIGGGFFVLNDDANVSRVHLNSSGNSYFNGGNFGIGLTSPAYKLDVIGPSGSPVSVARLGNASADRYVRVGVTGLSSGNSAMFLQGQHSNNNANVWHLLLNPFTSGVGIGGTRDPAAALDVTGSVAVSNNSYLYTPYDGSGANTGTVRAGIQVDGNSQSLNFYTANAYRGGMRPDGSLYIGNFIGIGLTSNVAWTSRLQLSGDITLTPAVSTVMWNLYYDGAWRYANNGAGFYWRNDTGHAQLGGAPSGTASGSTSPYTILDVDLTNRFFGVNCVPAYTGDFQGNRPGDNVSLRVGNTAPVTGAYGSFIFVDLNGLPNGYMGMSVNYNSGIPYSQLSQGSALTGPLYISATSEVRLQTQGQRLSVLPASIFSTVPFTTNTTAANYFGNVLVQGIAGNGGFIRTTDLTALFLGANSNNYVGITANGSHFYPVGHNTMNLGGSGNAWANIDTFKVTLYGSSSGQTGLFAQATAANNAVFLPNSAGTLLIGGAQLSAALGADVALNNTSLYFNGPAIALPAGGTYLLIATLTIQDIGSAANLDCRLWNGSASIGSARGWIASAGGITTVTLIGISAGGVTITSQAADVTSTGGALRWNLSGNQADCRIIAFKVAS